MPLEVEDDSDGCDSDSVVDGLRKARLLRLTDLVFDLVVRLFVGAFGSGQVHCKNRKRQP